MKYFLKQLCAGCLLCVVVAGCKHMQASGHYSPPSANDGNATWAHRVEALLREASSYWVVDLIGEMNEKPPLRLEKETHAPGDTSSTGYVAVGKQLIRVDRSALSTTPLPSAEIIRLIQTYDPKSEPPPCDCFANPVLLILLLDAHKTFIGSIELDNHGYIHIKDTKPNWAWRWYGIPKSLAEIVRKNTEKFNANKQMQNIGTNAPTSDL